MSLACLRGVRPRFLRPLALFLSVLAVVLLGGHARALPPDPAARGLDLFVHVAPVAVPGGQLEVVVKAYGFPAVTEARPLAGAAVEAGWDPESLDGDAPPPSVHATTDAEGRARFVVEVPRGRPMKLSLLVGVRHGGHARVRAASVERSPAAGVELYTADTRVVPTSTISAWVRVVGSAGEPLAGSKVTVSLFEGGVARRSERLVTDLGGLVMARVPIPRIDEPVWSWTLRAELETVGVKAAELELTPREETPGTPTLGAAWDEPPNGARPGDRIPFRIRLRDATGQPVIDHAVRYWIGTRGTTPPATDKDWEKASTRATTDGGGEITGHRDAPTLVAAKGTSLILIARAVVEGHALEKKDEASIGVARASATLTPEAPALVPGVTQRLLLTVSDGRAAGVAGEFSVTGDGLATTVKTDDRGEAEVSWTAPAGIGASRNAGPCAGGVAAAVTVRPIRDLEALRGHGEPFQLCVPVDRDAEGIVRLTPNVARPGERVRIAVTRGAGAPAARAGRGSHSVVLRARDHAHAVTAWLEPQPDGTSAGDVTLPPGSPSGTWDVSVALPDGARASRVAGGELLVVPTVLSSLTAKRTGGRATPGGAVEIEAELTDGHGKGLAGTVSAVVLDAFGGGSADVTALDTRSRLCRTAGVVDDRCVAVLERAPETEALRRALFSHGARSSIKPLNDPGAHASTDLEKAFGDVLRSLEGAVFEAAKTPETLLDARRKEGGRWTFNPELFTIVTASMGEPPQTPGGEPLSLADLVTVDPQVTFDNVARRVTRLKLFRVLAAVRDVRIKQNLDPEEPVFKDPNALLRRLVRQNALTEDMLLDPWGGTIQFVRGAGVLPPFLGTVRGFELRAPGPDGVVGTGDDVRDPFERVVRSGSPYARAVKEDAIVDAKWDMVVSDETVRAWTALFDEWTGTQMGDSFGAGGMGLSGVGEGGGGRGEGIGLGSIGTIGHGGGRGSRGIESGDAYWSAPVRTDAAGRVRLTVPLGGAETTWKVALVGVPDGLSPASTTMDVASDLPLSVRAQAGARWVEGDTVVTRAFVRNRTDKPLRATIEASAEGAASVDGASRSVVDVPARGGRSVEVRVRAARPGAATLVLKADAPGVPGDVLRHTWEVIAAGEPRIFTRTAWAEGSRDLRIELDRGYRTEGAPRVVLERGYDDAVAAALDSLEPERQTSAHALLDAYDASLRIQRWATTRDTPRHRALAFIADGIGRRALGRYATYAAKDRSPREGSTSAPGLWAMNARWIALAKPPRAAREAGDKDAPDAICPPAWETVKAAWASSSALPDDDEVLEVEPAPGASVPPCWGAYVGGASRELFAEGDPEHVARALLAFAERPHRAAATAVLADRLRRLVKLDEDGDIDDKGALLDRSRRALVYAALLRTTRFGTPRAPEAALFGKLAVLRDAAGGYGSSTATLAVVRALLASQLDGKGESRVRVRAAGIDREISVPESGSVTLPLPAGALDVSLDVAGPGLVARFERPVLRLWSRPPPAQESPVSVDVTWPESAKAGGTAPLRLHVKHGKSEKVEIDVRVPLPPGVTLGAAVPGVAEVQGVLAVRLPVDRDGSVLEVPMRFGLGGKTTAPEATARISRSTSGVATSPARAVVVR